MDFRVMTFNVRYFGQALRGAGSTRKSMDAITRTIAGLETLPDIICLQEVETRSLRSTMSHTRGRRQETQFEALMARLEVALTDKARATKYRGLYFPAHTYQIAKAKLFTTGLAILVSSRFEIETHNAEAPHDITTRRIPSLAKLKQSRICAHMRVCTPQGQTLDVFNTHMSLPSFATMQFIKTYPGAGFGQNQIQEAGRIVDYVNAHRSSNCFLLMGDFNSVPSSPVYDHLVRQAQVEDPFSSTLGLSVDRLSSEWPTAGFLNLRMRLDHMFMGEGLRCLDVTGSHKFTAQGQWTGLSDHVPLLGRFTPI